MNLLSARLMLSGQNACPGSARMADSALATVLGGPGEFGYFGCPTIRRSPFSVIGHVANALRPTRPNHA